MDIAKVFSPHRDVLSSAVLADVLEDAYLPDRLDARGRVGPAECNLAKRRIF